MIEANHSQISRFLAEMRFTDKNAPLVQTIPDPCGEFKERCRMTDIGGQPYLDLDPPIPFNVVRFCHDLLGGQPYAQYPDCLVDMDKEFYFNPIQGQTDAPQTEFQILEGRVLLGRKTKITIPQAEFLEKYFAEVSHTTLTPQARPPKPAKPFSSLNIPDLMQQAETYFCLSLPGLAGLYMLIKKAPGYFSNFVDIIESKMNPIPNEWQDIYEEYKKKQSQNKQNSHRSTRDYPRKKRRSNYWQDWTQNNQQTEHRDSKYQNPWEHDDQGYENNYSLDEIDSTLSEGDALETLGLDPARQYHEAQLKTAFRSKVIKLHPDQGGDPEEFIKVVEAYERFFPPKSKFH